jgi:hypothetical protein
MSIDTAIQTGSNSSLTGSEGHMKLNSVRNKVRDNVWSELKTSMNSPVFNLLSEVIGFRKRHPVLDDIVHPVRISIRISISDVYET